jgi:beta-glucosidase
MDARTRGALAALATAACIIVAALTPGATSAATGRSRSAVAPGSQATCPWLNDSESISARVSQLMSKMSLGNEIDLVEGHGSTNPYVFYEPPIPSLCIPQLGEEDGPNGVGDELTGVTQLPAGVALAATFSPALARQYGAVVGAEEWGKGAAVNLGPTINLDRDPRWGRSFESLTEDPYLSGDLASSEIDGVQSQGEMSQVKHYDDYDQETNRNTPQDDEIIAERPLQELYLKSFQTVIQDANPASVMCSYASFTIPDAPVPSAQSEQYACQDNYLENDVLKQDWDFPGFITSDYGALHSTDGILDGTDQEQPENTYYGTALETEIENGTIARSVLNTAISRELTEMFRFNLFDDPPTGTTSDVVTSPAHQNVSTKVAEDGTTLLKNTGNTLPLSSSNGGTIAVIGPSASATPTYGGGGSATVVPFQTVSPLQGLEAQAGGQTHLTYTQGLPTDASLGAIPSANLSPAYAPTSYGGSYSGTLTAPETGTYVLAVTNTCGCYTSTYLSVDGKQILDNPGTPPQSVYSVAVSLTKGQHSLGLSGFSSALTWATPSDLAPDIAQAVAAAKSASTAVVVVSDDTETEAADRLKLGLPSAQNELISAVAAANPHTVVVVDAGAPVTMPWLSEVSSVLDAWYPGQTNGTALANVLFGSVDPSGHLPVTFPQSLSQVPAATAQQFPGVNGKVEFSEGLDIGYRSYDARNITPLFPFGYGLSYTTFQYSGLQILTPATGATGNVKVSATVTNTGTRSGSDVAQLYLEDPAAAGEPPRQLAGFDRVTLGAGQSQRVTFKVTPESEQWWDTSAGGWTQSPGAYDVYVGDSSALANLPLQGSFTLATTPGARQVTVTAPSTMTPNVASTVTVDLSPSGTQILNHVTLALQLPEGWTATPITKATFSNVAPGTSLSTQFAVVPAADSPNINAVIHATASLGPDLSREAGTSTTVG